MRNRSYWKETIPENRRKITPNKQQMFPVLSLAQIARYMFMLEPITGSRVELLLESISAQEKKEIQLLVMKLLQGQSEQWGQGSDPEISNCKNHYCLYTWIIKSGESSVTQCCS